MSQNILYKVASPYAEALLELSKVNNIIDQTSQDLSYILKTISDSSELKFFLSNPLIETKVKKKIINQIFADQLNDHIIKFLSVLIDRRRIALLEVIIDRYFNLVYQEDEIIVAEVSTVSTLTELQQSNLISKIKLMTNCKNVKLIANIDSTLIGGFIIKIGSKIIDTSLSSKLKQIALYLDTN